METFGIPLLIFSFSEGGMFWEICWSFDCLEGDGVGWKGKRWCQRENGMVSIGIDWRWLWFRKNLDHPVCEGFGGHVNFRVFAEFFRDL
ncbi:hypothetical protein AKJ39_01910, partial [candidate division MSBL1 archaeon SCGC-AAA259J03]